MYGISVMHYGRMRSRYPLREGSGSRLLLYLNYPTAAAAFERLGLDRNRYQVSLYRSPCVCRGNRSQS